MRKDTFSEEGMDHEERAGRRVDVGKGRADKSRVEARRDIKERRVEGRIGEFEGRKL